MTVMPPFPEAPAPGQPGAPEENEEAGPQLPGWRRWLNSEDCILTASVLTAGVIVIIFGTVTLGLIISRPGWLILTGAAILSAALYCTGPVLDRRDLRPERKGPQK
jgi:hypothetical protein